MSISWMALAMAQAAQPATPLPTDAQAPMVDGQRAMPTKKPGEFEVTTSINLYHPRSDIILVRGRYESAWDVPASAIELQNPDRHKLAGEVTSIDQIATAVPGVWIVNDQDPGTNILSIRGATTDRLQQASVSYVLDGVPLADTELFTARLLDVGRIEVLKGPQGALFGKNAAGGVIAIGSARIGTGNVLGGYIVDAQGNRLRDLPKYVPANGFVQIGLGNGGLREIEGARSFELPANWVGRAAGVWSAADGWITNTTLNKLVDATQTKMVRLSATGEGFGFDWTIRSHWLEEDGGAAWASSNNVTGKAGGRLSGAVLTPPIGDYEGRAWRRWVQTSLSASQDLGEGTLEFLFARDSYQKRWSEELDYRPGALTFLGFPAFPNGIQPISQPIDVRATTAQAIWSALNNSDNFGVRLGVFYQRTDKDRVDDFGPLLFGTAPFAYATRSAQSAIFGELEWKPIDDLSLEVQARYDQDDRRQTITHSKTGALFESREKDFGRFQPRVSLAYRVSDWTSVYGVYGEAFRPGGFNPKPASNSIWTSTYRPEITSSFEIGLKSSRIRLSENASISLQLAAFSNRVTDYQNYTFIDGQSVTLSVDEVTVKGFEASISAFVFNRTKLGASYALAQSEIQRFIATDPLLGSPATRNYTGKAVPNAPRDTGRVFGEFATDVGQYSVKARIDANYAGKTFYEIDNVLYSPSRWWADLNLSAYHRDKDWSLSLKAENFTDERWAISAFGQGMTGLLAGLGPGGPFDTFTINRGRRISLTLRKEL
jgi:iron complex outermembrane recepter protein